MIPFSSLHYPKQPKAQDGNTAFTCKARNRESGQLWNPFDEETLLFERSEDRWLRRLGIDPDGISCRHRDGAETNEG